MYADIDVPDIDWRNYPDDSPLRELDAAIDFLAALHKGIHPRDDRVVIHADVLRHLAFMVEELAANLVDLEGRLREQLGLPGAELSKADQTLLNLKRDALARAGNPKP